LSGCGITGVVLFCCAACLLRNSSERGLAEDAWRRLVVVGSGRNARACGRRRRGPRGKRKRGIDWRVAMVVRGEARGLGSPHDDGMKIF
jgi:hypothetical protein